MSDLSLKVAPETLVFLCVFFFVVFLNELFLSINVSMYLDNEANLFFQ